MYHQKDKLAARLYEIMDDLMVGEDGHEISIDNLLTPSQKYSLIMSIMQGLPPTNMEMIFEFNRTFKVQKETTHIVSDWQGSELAFRLILEESLELATALGMDRHKIYEIFISLLDKTPTEGKPSLVEVFDALLDLLYVTYRNFYTMGLEEIAYEGMEEVHSSNMSKLVPDTITIDKLKELVEGVRQSKGVEVRTVALENGYVALENAKTGKVMKPATYREADLNKLIINHLKNRENGS